MDMSTVYPLHGYALQLAVENWRMQQQLGFQQCLALSALKKVFEIDSERGGEDHGFFEEE